jgi:eukaryotic-like serine/threonine-protein kinase
MVGQTIHHYRILEKIGQGGMGVVYKAEDTVLRRPVALKFLTPAAGSDDSLRVRFYREAQAAGALNHPHICPVYGIEENDGRLYIVMAYLEGVSLDKLIGEGLPAAQAVGYAIEIGEGLKEAHDNGIVHRDIKGSNIIVTAKGRAVITDFGLAQLADRSRITRSGTALGTLRYMSPEQAQGRPVDRRTDIWSLGVVLYQMLTGKHPFRGSRIDLVVRSIISDPPAPLDSSRPELSGETGRVLSKALAKSPEDRYQHVDDLLVDLRAVHRTLARAGRDADRVSANPITVRSASEAEEATTAIGAPVRLTRAGGWRWAAYLLGALLLLTALWFWLRLPG